MDLKEFVVDAIAQLHEAVSVAIVSHDEKGSLGRINPVFQDSMANTIGRLPFATSSLMWPLPRQPKGNGKAKAVSRYILLALAPLSRRPKKTQSSAG